MKLTQGVITSGNILDGGMIDFTIRSANTSNITIGEPVSVCNAISDTRLRNLCEYLENRSSAMNATQVFEGVYALKTLLGMI